MERFGEFATLPDGRMLFARYPGVFTWEPDGELPFMGNRVFDATWDGLRLVLAYWGQRRFDVLEGADRFTIHRVDSPFLPHWVATGDGLSFLFASSLDPGQPIRPRLWMWDGASLERVWSAP